MNRRIGQVAVAIAAALHVWVLVSILSDVRSQSSGGPRIVGAPLQLFNDAVHRLGSGADFFALYHAGVMLNRHESPFVIGRERITPAYYSYRYLMSLAEAARPMAALLPPWTAYALWLVVLELGMLGILWFIRRSFPPAWVPWLWALSLGFTPFWLELQMGQFSFAMGALALFTGLLLEARRPALSLLTWTASAFLKVYSLVLIPVFLRRRTALWLAVSLLVFGAINAYAFSLLPEGLKAFLDRNLVSNPVVPTDTGNFGFSFVYLNLFVNVMHRRVADWPALYRQTHLLILGFTAALVLLRRPRPSAAIAALLLAHQITYMQVWEHHYSMLLGPLLLLLRDVREDAALRNSLLVGLVALAIPSPFVLWNVTPLGALQMNSWPFWQRMALWGCKAIPCVWLYVVALVACWQREPAPAVVALPEPAAPAA